MRIITEQDKRGLLVALRTFLRHLNGERLSGSAGTPLIVRLLACGVSFDRILNPQNWARAKNKNENLTFKDYVDYLCDASNEVLSLKEEMHWHETSCGFDIVAECVHDFFQEISGRGGRWNIPSSLTNLAKAIERFTLEALMSEKLIGEITAKNADVNYFGYVAAIAGDFKSLSVDVSPTAEEMAPGKREALQDEAPAEHAPEDEPFPEPEQQDEYEMQDDGTSGPSTEVITRILFPNPNDTKKEMLKKVLADYTFKEVNGLIRAIPDGERLTLGEILDVLVRGKFDIALEVEETREVHRSLNADLMQSYIICVNGQGVQMDEKTASQHDILHENWDFSTPNAKKLQKLLRLIYDKGKDDPDLLDAVPDIEQLYGEN